MIHYLSTAQHAYTLRTFLASWGHGLRRRIRPLSYETALAGHRVPAGAYLFSDLERLTPQQSEQAFALRAALQRAGWPVLNHPTAALRRYEMLRRLHAAGINPFNVYRLVDDPAPQRWPVFLRAENEHSGAQSGLLNDADELAAAVRQWQADGRAREHALVVEFCDTRDADGLYRKYSVLRFGDRLIPRHLFFGPAWMLKVGRNLTPEHVAIEAEFLATHPHAQAVRAVFDLARIEYGRIDYSVRDGGIVVWEINTNPHLATFRDFGGEARHAVHRRFAAAFGEALADFDRPGPPGPVTWREPPRPAWKRWRKAANNTLRDRRARQRHRP